MKIDDASAPHPGPRPVTGAQYVLRRGAARAQIGSVAAVLREFSVAGTRYTETWADTMLPPLAAGIVLIPWPNRVAGGTWTWDGGRQELDITDRAHGNAIHGLGRFTDYVLRELTDDRVTLGTVIHPQHGWPFTLDTSATYALVDGPGLTVTHTVRNIGAARAVFGCGAHPYLRVGEVPTGELTLTVRADRVLTTNEAMIPVGAEPLTGPLAALPAGARLDDLHLDIGFAGLSAAPSGRIEHVLAAPDGRILTIWADDAFGYTVVFTPDEFPDDPRFAGVAGGVHRAVAVEPMTCPTNALVTGEALIELAPGETWSASWGLEPGRA